MSLFEPPASDHVRSASQQPATPSPLADRMRPETIEEYVGQLHILGPGKPLRKQIERENTAGERERCQPARKKPGGYVAIRDMNLAGC